MRRDMGDPDDSKEDLDSTIKQLKLWGSALVGIAFLGAVAFVASDKEVDDTNNQEPPAKEYMLPSPPEPK